MERGPSWASKHWHTESASETCALTKDQAGPRSHLHRWSLEHRQDIHGNASDRHKIEKHDHEGEAMMDHVNIARAKAWNFR